MRGDDTIYPKPLRTVALYMPDGKINGSTNCNVNETCIADREGFFVAGAIIFGIRTTFVWPIGSNAFPARDSGKAFSL